METLYRIIREKIKDGEEIKINVLLTEEGRIRLCKFIHGELKFKDIPSELTNDIINRSYKEFTKGKGLGNESKVQLEDIKKIIIGEENVINLYKKFDELELTEDGKLFYLPLFEKILERIEKQLKLIQSGMIEKTPLSLEGSLVGRDNIGILLQHEDNLFYISYKDISLISAPIKRNDSVYKKHYKEFFS